MLDRLPAADSEQASKVLKAETKQNSEPSLWVGELFPIKRQSGLAKQKVALKNLESK
jgi:hypothetical protein